MVHVVRLLEQSQRKLGGVFCVSSFFRNERGEVHHAFVTQIAQMTDRRVVAAPEGIEQHSFAQCGVRHDDLADAQ